MLEVSPACSLSNDTLSVLGVDFVSSLHALPLQPLEGWLNTRHFQLKFPHVLIEKTNQKMCSPNDVVFTFSVRTFKSQSSPAGRTFLGIQILKLHPSTKHTVHISDDQWYDASLSNRFLVQVFCCSHCFVVTLPYWRQFQSLSKHVTAVSPYECDRHEIFVSHPSYSFIKNPITFSCQTQTVS